MQQKLAKIKGEIGSSTLIVVDFNTLLTMVDRIRKKTNKEREDLINQLALADIKE